jgi:5-methylcytosine-specific restriction endonuclease McrA
MSHFLDCDPTLENYWRSVIHSVRSERGVVQIRFGQIPDRVVRRRAQSISLEQLAEPFSRHMVEHLAGAPKQATSASSRFLDYCKRFSAQEISKDELIGQTVKLGFQNVIDAFHVVNRAEIPVRFFHDDRLNGGGIILTDEFFRLRDRLQFGNLPQEVEARWRLVETAWQMKINRAALVVDIDTESLVVSREGRRTTLTGCRDALNGYQKGKCFYCFRDISSESLSDLQADVDHLFPRMLLQAGVRLPLDGVWNLVLACRDCNRGVDGKSSRLPHHRLLERLDTRNEFFISSHHPLRETLLAQTGGERPQRIAFLNSTYQASREWLIHTWETKFEHESAF